MTEYRMSGELGSYPGEIHRDLNPTWLGAVMAMRGMIPPRSQGARYLDIGCGSGLDIIALACANPDMQFTGVDLDPAHIAQAEALAARIGLTNATFLCAGFDDPCLGGDHDYVVAHGIHSWLPEAGREGLRRTLARTVSPQGICVLHYLVEPGAHLWRSLRAVLMGLAEHMPVSDALDRMATMAETGWGIFATLPGAEAMVDVLKGWPEAMLRHDLLNNHYDAVSAPMLMADCARLGLDFVCSTDPLAEHDVFSLPTGMAARSAQERALLSDIATGRLSRVDIFAPSVRRMAPEQGARMLEGLRFALMPGRERVEGFHVPTVFGPVTPAPAMAGDILGRLRRGPASLAELAALPAVSGDVASLLELVAGMMAVGLVHPLRGLRQDGRGAARFNGLACTEALGPRVPGPVSVATGGLIWAGSTAHPASGAEISALIAADRLGFFA